MDEVRVQVKSNKIPNLKVENWENCGAVISVGGRRSKLKTGKWN